MLVYERRDGADYLLVVLNMTPVPRETYRIGVPEFARYAVELDTDDARFGGSGFAPAHPPLRAEDEPWHGQPQSLVLALPPLAAVVLRPVERLERAAKPTQQKPAAKKRR